MLAVPNAGLSLLPFIPTNPCVGVPDLLDAPLPGNGFLPPCAGLGFVAGRFLFSPPETYSRPSTFAVNLALYSSPTSLSYLSRIVQSSHVLPSNFVWSCDSQNDFQASLPPADMRASSVDLNASMVMLRTKEMWTPRPRWIPEQERHMKMPNLGDAYT
jgi:hypothetical protein